MTEEKIQETDDGYYVQSGDVLEWKWKKDEPKAEPEPKKVTTKTAEPLTKKAAKK
jgi:hypothetical protein